MNEIDSFFLSLKNQIGDKEKLGGKLSEEEQSKIEEVINEKIAWLEENQVSLERSSSSHHDLLFHPRSYFNLVY